jgi:hypothetical protein
VEPTVGGNVNSLSYSHHAYKNSMKKKNLQGRHRRYLQGVNYGTI